MMISRFLILLHTVHVLGLKHSRLKQTRLSRAENENFGESGIAVVYFDQQTHACPCICMIKKIRSLRMRRSLVQLSGVVNAQNVDRVSRSDKSYWLKNMERGHKRYQACIGWLKYTTNSSVVFNLFLALSFCCCFILDLQNKKMQNLKYVLNIRPA